MAYIRMPEFAVEYFRSLSDDQKEEVAAWLTQPHSIPIFDILEAMERVQNG